MDIFEQEYRQMQSRETVGDQFAKLAAAVDGSDFMHKLNPVQDTSQPSGATARSLEEGLRLVESSREGRGKVTAEVEKKPAPIQHPVHRDVAFALTRGIQDERDPVQMMKTAAERSAWDRWGKTALTAGGLALGGVAAGGGALLAGRRLLRAQKAFNQQAAGKATAAVGDFMKNMGRELDALHQTTKGIQQASKGIVNASKSLDDVAGSMNRTVGGMNQTMSGMSGTMKNMDRTMQNIGSAMSSTMKSVSSDMGATAKNLQAMSDDVRKITQPVGKVADVPRGAQEYVGGLLSKITKRGSDDSFASLVEKVASEGKIRTLENWRPKTAEEKDPYVRRVGRFATRTGGTLGASAGALAGGLAGAAIGARRGRLGTGAAIGALGGGAAGGVSGALGLKAVAERSARQLSPSQRKAATRFNVAHAKYVGGDLSRKEFSKETNKFMRSQKVFGG